MDIRMYVMDGIEATRQITSARGPSGARVLILTTFDLDNTSSRRCERERAASRSRAGPG